MRPPACARVYECGSRSARYDFPAFLPWREPVDTLSQGLTRRKPAIGQGPSGIKARGLCGKDEPDCRDTRTVAVLITDGSLVLDRLPRERSPDSSCFPDRTDQAGDLKYMLSHLFGAIAIGAAGPQRNVRTIVP